MIAPSTPSPTRPRIAATSSSVDTPPDATTGRSVRAQTSRSSGEVRALEHAVLGDVGDDVARAALGVEAGERLPQVAALPGPAPGGEGGAAHVEADGHPVAVLGDGAGGPLGVLERGGAEVDPAAARGQRALERLGVADAAAHLDLDVERARRCRRAARRWSRARRPRRGRRGAATRRPAPATRGRPRAGRRTPRRCRRRPGRAGRRGPRRRRRRAGAPGGARSVHGWSSGWSCGVGCPGGRSGSHPSTRRDQAQSAGRRSAAVDPVHGSGPGGQGVAPGARRRTAAHGIPNARTAIGQSERTQFAQQGQPGLAGLLGVELGRRQRPVLDRGDEPLAVGGPGDPRLDHRERPVGRRAAPSVCAA